MKLLITIIFFNTLYLYSQKDMLLIADFESEFIITNETNITFLKEQIYNNINFSEEVTFDNVEIVKREIIFSEKNEEIYFITFSDTSKNVKIARYLHPHDNKLYVIFDHIDGSIFELTYQICVGKSECSPEVFLIDGVKKWICGNYLSCSINPEDSLKKDCLSFGTIIKNEFKD